MGVLALTTPNRAGVVSTGAAVAASDTIPSTVLGSKGVILEIINGNASPDVMTISDASITPSGAPAAANGPTVTNGTSKVFHVRPEQVDSAGNVTVTHSVTATVTYKMYPKD